MRKLLGLVVVILALAGALSIAAAVSMVRGGFSARPKPSRIEARAVMVLRDLATPRKAKDRKSPIAVISADVLARGRAHFGEECAGCHGNDGRGSDFGRSMFPQVPDLREAQRDMTDGEIFWVVTNGIRFSGMPAFGTPGDAQEEEEHWEVVAFVRHLPAITKGEIELMRAERARRLEQSRALQPAGTGKPAAQPSPAGRHEHKRH